MTNPASQPESSPVTHNFSCEIEGFDSLSKDEQDDAKWTWIQRFGNFAEVPIPPEAWAKSTRALYVAADGPDYQQPVWFKSEPVTRNVYYRMLQLQLVTDSHDQGWGGNHKTGAWSWFELAIFPDADATEPRKSSTGEPLAWRSHANRIGNEEKTRNYGTVFDRRSELLVHLKIGDVIAVRACARFAGWENFARRGWLLVRLSKEDLFNNNAWTIAGPERPYIPDVMENGDYTLISDTSCSVKAADGGEVSWKFWITTPKLRFDDIRRIEEIQLFTESKHQIDASTPENGGSSWFDLAILETPTSTEPMVVNGVSLVWSSHSNMEDAGMRTYDGDVFDQNHFLVHSLKDGNVIAVRVCAQNKGSENQAESCRLVVRFDNKKHDDWESTEIPDLASSINAYDTLKNQANLYFKGIAAEEKYSSPVAALMEQAAPSGRLDDMVKAATGRPLRLLCLDGGGVRGISSLTILRAVMLELTKDPKHIDDVRPHEYFDMIAGTSTGGLLALMIGRLRMTLKECEDAYYKISKDVFENPQHGITEALRTGEGKFDGEKLKKAVQDLCQKHLKDANAKMKDPNTTSPDSDACRIVVMSCLASKVTDGNTAVHLRTWASTNEDEEFNEWPIWQAARATSAAPTYFEPVTIGEGDHEKVYVDGGLGCNNPVFELLGNVYATYGVGRPIGCLLSIGTGIPAEQSIYVGLNLPKMVESAFSLATNSEALHIKIAPSVASLPHVGDKKYFRFNLSKLNTEHDWIKKIQQPYNWKKPWQFRPSVTWTYDSLIAKLEAWDRMDDLVYLTEYYLQSEKGLEPCASRLNLKAQS